MADLEVSVWPPEPIETERLLLRPTQAVDRPGYIELLCSPEVRIYLGGPVGTREELECQAPEVPGARSGVFAIVRGGVFIGMIQLDRRDPFQPGHIRPEGGELEVGYLLLRPFWGYGYAQEALRGVLDWAAVTLADEDVLLVTQTMNVRSLRLAQRVGFREVERFELYGAEQWLGQLHLRSASAH